MGFLDNAKDAAEATGKKLGRAVDDAKERISDKADEVQADSKVKGAEAETAKAEREAEATRAKNEYKESLRD